MIKKTVDFRTRICCKDNILIEIKNLETGEIRQITTHNDVSTDGLNWIRDMVNNDSGAGVTHFAMLEDSSEVVRLGVTQRDATVDGQLTLKCYVPGNQGNGYTIDEVRLYNASSGGTYYASGTHDGIEKTSSIQITYTWVGTWTDN
jgi:hypothetical protein